MLARTAEAFFWIGRYLERAEYAARTTDVHHQILLEYPDPEAQNETWGRLLGMGGDLPLYLERHGEVTARGALEFIALDVENPNSLVNGVAAARENARTIKDQLSSEVWNHLNRFYLEVRSIDRGDFWVRPHEVLRFIRDSGYTLHGVISNTMLHDERLAFWQLGRDTERAGRTVRLLEGAHLQDPPAVGASVAEFHQWVAVLRSASAYEAYRKTYRTAPDPAKIADFLLFSDRFPRSVRFCARSLARLVPVVEGPGSARGDRLGEPERLVGQLAADLDFASPGEVYAEGLDGYLTNLGERLDAVSDAFARSYFRHAVAPGEPHAPLPQRRRAFPRPDGGTLTIGAVVKVEHAFHYRYPQPVEGVRTVLRVAPNQRYGRQRLLDVRWSMDPPGEVRQHVDAFGNQVWQIDHARITHELACTVEMRVENSAVYHAEGALALRGVPLVEEVGLAGPAEYASLTRLVDASEGMLAMARRLAEDHPQPTRLAEALMREVHGRMAFCPGVTTVETPASEAFSRGQGVCQDFSHIMLALARLAGLSARYVSGYLPAEGVMHAWVEVLVSDPVASTPLWVAYDPTHARRCDESYVTVAMGRDYQDIAPMSGFYTGKVANTLEVKVTSRIETRGPVARTGTTPLGMPVLELAMGQEAQ